MRSKSVGGGVRSWSVLSGLILVSAAGVIAIPQSACSSDESNNTPPPEDAGQEAAPAPPMKTEAQFAEEAQRSMKTITTRQIDALTKAVADLQAAAPTPAGRGWDATQDADAITKMRTAWRAMHVAYAHLGPMLQPQYTALDTSINTRYDDFLTTIGAAGDQTLFDDQGVTGIHAIERILFANVAPPAVVTTEAKIPGYKVAAFPATEAEAADFKNKLVAKLVADVKAMSDGYAAATVDNKYAFSRLIPFMEAQRDIINKAATGQEMSRYSQETLLDLQATLEGVQLSYKIFQPWLLMGHMAPQDLPKHGPAHDKPIQAGFGDLIAAYTAAAGANQGPAIPPAPSTWSVTAPTEDDLKTSYGKIWALATAGADPAKQGSVASEMNVAATILSLK